LPRGDDLGCSRNGAWDGRCVWCQAAREQCRANGRVHSSCASGLVERPPGRPWPSARRCEQRGNIFQSEGASLSVRVSGAYLHPRLRRSASSWTGSSLRSSRVRGMRRSDTVGTAGLIGPHARRLAVDGASGPPTPALVGHRPPTRPEKLRFTMVPGTSRVAPDPWCDASVAGGR
jgi:hypothetical protein